MPGTRWLRLYDNKGAASPRPFVIGVNPEKTEKEPNDSLKQAETLGSGPITVNGRLQKRGDVDCFVIHMEKESLMILIRAWITDLKEDLANLEGR